MRNTAMVETMDIGDSKNIHPKSKQDVGKRLALAARALVYGENVGYSGPLFRQALPDGNGMRVWFEHAKSGLASVAGAPLTGFEVAGSNRKFVPGTARIEGGTVLVFSPGVPEPQAIRYGWANDPAVNLVNRDGLPASPFRTDAWPQ